MRHKEEQADKRNEQTRKEPHETVPISDYKKLNVTNNSGNAAKSEENVTKHCHIF
jgi:hypothetical protein